MSANADLIDFSISRTPARDVRDDVRGGAPIVAAPFPWNVEDFAREQIRGLVRQLFLGASALALRQIVFTSVDAETETGQICEEVARELSAQTRARVALVDCAIQAGPPRKYSSSTSLKARSEQIGANLWRVPAGCEQPTSTSWESIVEELRCDFDYVVFDAPLAALSTEAMLLGQLTDGVVLIVEANRTRKAAARFSKQKLEAAQVRILGTVLSERTFPIPEKLYRMF